MTWLEPHKLNLASYFFVLQEWEKPRGKETEKEGLQHFLRFGLSHAQTVSQAKGKWRDIKDVMN